MKNNWNVFIPPDVLIKQIQDAAEFSKYADLQNPITLREMIALDQPGEVVLFDSSAGGGVKRNAEEEGDEGLADCDNVFVLWLARSERGERFRRLFQGDSDLFGSHDRRRGGGTVKR